MSYIFIFHIVVYTYCTYSYQVLRIKVENTAQLDIINNLGTSAFPSIDHWNEPEVGKYADVMIGPSDFQSLSNYLGREHLYWTVWIPDVGR